MHELSICQALLDQVEQIARDHDATRVERILLKVGPLAGVEPALLQHAWPLAAAGTIAESAELVIEASEIRVRCEACGVESAATANRLLCGVCGGFRTRLLSGDEMLLARLEMAVPNALAESVAGSQPAD
jgi:hydrogenase nickel incorporation protein HypA/HybF